MKANIARWLIALFVLALITTNLLAQGPLPPRRPEWPAGEMPRPPRILPPRTLPQETRRTTSTLAPNPPAPRATVEAYPLPPTQAPYPEPYPAPKDGLRRLLFQLEGPSQRPAALSPTPTRDPSWEREFQTVHKREPNAQDVADRHWSLNFLSQTGRPPTQAEWEAHYYEQLQ